MLGDDEASPHKLHQLIMLVDANAFGRRAWVQVLIDASEAGYARLYWTPTIVEEMARFRQLLWIRNWMLGGGTRLTMAVRRQLLEESNRWMDFVRPHFHVIEDKPVHTPAWSEWKPAPPEAPIWVAARQIQVDVIVTRNLRSGPPANEGGAHVFEDVLYLDPVMLAAFLDRWGDICQTGNLIPDLTDETADAARASVACDGDADEGEATLPPAILEFLVNVARRRAEERAASTDEDISEP